MEPPTKKRKIEMYAKSFLNECRVFHKFFRSDSNGMIGNGTYGQVFKCVEKSSNRVVAVKKMATKEKGIPSTTIREIALLKATAKRHENIVELLDVCTGGSTTNNIAGIPSIYLIFEYCDYDLQKLFLDKYFTCTPAECKMLAKQILEGLHYLHVNSIMHRDLKPSNILVNRRGVLKIADFGLARPLKPNNLTPKMVTLWWRAPELLLGSREYDSAIDIWSAGCIIAEIYLRPRTLLAGKSEIDQLNKITLLCGSVTNKLPSPDQFDFNNTNGDTSKLVKNLSLLIKDHGAVMLINKMLVWNPYDRIRAIDALDDVYFWTDPMPQSLDKTLESHYNFCQLRYKQRLQQQQQQQQQKQKENRPPYRPVF